MPTYEQHWRRKVRALGQAKVLIKTDVECPEGDGEFLHTVDKEYEQDRVRRVGEWPGARVLKVKHASWAICPNGHRHDL